MLAKMCMNTISLALCAWIVLFIQYVTLIQHRVIHNLKQKVLILYNISHFSPTKALYCLQTALNYFSKMLKKRPS